MTAHTSRVTLALLVVFVLSGIAGLLYQSVWSHYLGLTLGHAAYAQTLVLAIFMGGMAVGAWLASRHGLRWKRLILAYAIVEGVIGLTGLVFHPLFVWYMGVSQETVLPAMGSPALAHTYQWLTATLLIAPQSILLGATFPLMSAGLIRILPGQQGEVLGGLYFTNSLGAALGALGATFLLLPLVGLPGTVMAAGLLNVLVAILAWALSKVLQEDQAPLPDPQVSRPGLQQPADASETRALGRTLLWATAASGAASFIYEIGWVRLLNQAFGTTVHSFELMLAAFILGLAFGGLWVRKRAAGISEPVRYVGYVQVLMAIAALVSIPVFTQSFHWVGWIMSSLSRSDSGYVVFELATAGIALLVMFPAAFLAGMTLPLFTVALLRAGAGEQVIGKVYAANTVGAIVGVAAMMHLLIPAIGIRWAIIAGALLDGVVGLVLLMMKRESARSSSRQRVPYGWAASALLLVCAVGFAAVAGRPDPKLQMSGVFRTGVINPEVMHVEFLKDGKTATVGLFNIGANRVISTNGKPDAGMSSIDDSPTPDEITMVMLGALPLALHPAPERVAFIGWGSGLSTHTVLGSDKPALVDTVEIEPVMHEAARLYGPRVSRAYDDPRSHLRVNDARTFFSTGARRYDVIVSEPSNPWVSGVASLFTKEFYAFLKSHLEDDGLLVQWLHTYELDDRLLASMIAALLSEFPNAELYLTNGTDLVIVAHRDAAAGRVVQQYPLSAPGTPLDAELKRVGFDRAEHLDLRRIGGPEVLANYVRTAGAIPHSDFFPLVSLEAPKTRFKGSSASALMALATNGLPVLDILDCRLPLPVRASLPGVEDSMLSQFRESALGLNALARAGQEDARVPGVSDTALDAYLSLRSLSSMVPDRPDLMRSWSESMASFAAGTIGHLSREDVGPTWDAAAWVPARSRQDPKVSALLAAYGAAANRNLTRMRSTAEAVLDSDQDSRSVREQMLVLAMLGAIGSGEPEAVPQLEAKWGESVGASASLGPIRAYLQAWADSGVTACMAK